ncbi:MAG TPA: segregation/condensation protein A [Microlunatus sp.]|nr:segregation/condensation protein A [Microlunatus sp.]
MASRFRAVVDGDDKLIWTPGAPPGAEFRLHHLTADPAETNDVAAAEPARVAELKGFLDAWMHGNTPPPRSPDAEDLELLEARDLLFARLLQYKAYKQIAAMLVRRLATEDRRHPRQVGPDPRYASLLPEIQLRITPDQLAALAAKAMAPKQADVISLAHLHTSTVSVREQAGLLIDRLRRAGTLTFRAVTADAGDRVTVVARFLALLELFREQAVAFEQLTPLGELTIRWTGSESGELDISDEFDEEAAIPADEST